MLYAIWAAESTYCGLHGMNTYGVVDCRNDAEAAEIGNEWSREVIHSYAHCIDSLLEEVAWILDMDREDLEDYIEDEERYDNAYREAEDEMVMYEYYPIRKDCGLTRDELEELEWEELRSYCE